MSTSNIYILFNFINDSKTELVTKAEIIYDWLMSINRKTYII
jgi:hypothetical protein